MKKIDVMLSVCDEDRSKEDWREASAPPTTPSW
jgi:hypothetical protein